MKNALRETQTLHAGCRKAEPKISAPPQTHFPVAQDGQNLISWRWSLPSPIDPIWWRSMHAISSYRGNRPTNKQTNTNRQDRLQYTAPQCNDVHVWFVNTAAVLRWIKLLHSLWSACWKVG